MKEAKRGPNSAPRPAGSTKPKDPSRARERLPQGKAAPVNRAHSLEAANGAGHKGHAWYFWRDIKKLRSFQAVVKDGPDFCRCRNQHHAGGTERKYPHWNGSGAKMAGK